MINANRGKLGLKHELDLNHLCEKITFDKCPIFLHCTKQNGALVQKEKILIIMWSTNWKFVIRGKTNLLIFLNCDISFKWNIYVIEIDTCHTQVTSDSQIFLQYFWMYNLNTLTGWCTDRLYCSILSLHMHVDSLSELQRLKAWINFLFKVLSHWPTSIKFVSWITILDFNFKGEFSS